MDTTVVSKVDGGHERTMAAVVVLLLQAGISAVTATGFGAYVAYSHLALHGGQVLPLVMPALWLALGLGVAGGRVWARRVALGSEAAALLAGGLAHILPGATMPLTPFIVSFVLPAVVIGLLASSNARRTDRRVTRRVAGYTVAVEE